MNPHWRISAVVREDGSGAYAWTPAEIAQIARAAQAFLAALPDPDGNLHHSVELVGVGVLPSDVEVTWPQPPYGDKPVGDPFMDKMAEQVIPAERLGPPPS